jgi:hypothetical protein
MVNRNQFTDEYILSKLRSSSICLTSFISDEAKVGQSLLVSNRAKVYLYENKFLLKMTASFRYLKREYFVVIANLVNKYICIPTINYTTVAVC